MNWFRKIERKMSKYAIKNLMNYIIILYVIGFIIRIFFPGVYEYYLSLDFSMIFEGQVWRIITFVLQPPTESLIFFIFALYFYYMIGTVLEQIWGAFKFNLYFFSGVLLTVLSGLIIYLVFGLPLAMSTHYINLALFMAFAFEQPDMQVLFMFVLPIRIKWLAYLDGAIFAITIAGGYLQTFLPDFIITGLVNLGFLYYPYNEIYRNFNYANATAALVSMLNFIVFMIFFKVGMPKNSVQRNFKKAMKTAQKAQKAKRPSFSETFYNANSEKSTWESANTSTIHSKSGAKHKCAVCGRTELDDDNLTFRFCSKCNGNYEYCSEHLYTHIHVIDNK